MSEASLSRRAFVTGAAAFALGGCSGVQTTPQTPLAPYDQALAYCRQGKLAEAIRILDELISADPGNGLLYNDRGAMRATRGEWGHALRDLDLAIALRPDHALSRLNRGKVYRTLANNWQPADAEKAQDYRHKAVADLEEVIRLDNAFPQAYLQLGLAYDEKEDPVKAYDAYDKAFKLLDEQPRLRSRLDPGLEDRCRERYQKLQNARKL